MRPDRRSRSLAIPVTYAWIPASIRRLSKIRGRDRPTHVRRSSDHPPRSAHIYVSPILTELVSSVSPNHRAETSRTHIRGEHAAGESVEKTHRDEPNVTDPTTRSIFLSSHPVYHIVQAGRFIPARVSESDNFRVGLGQFRLCRSSGTTCTSTTCSDPFDATRRDAKRCVVCSETLSRQTRSRPSDCASRCPRGNQ